MNDFGIFLKYKHILIDGVEVEVSLNPKGHRDAGQFHEEIARVSFMENGKYMLGHPLFRSGYLRYVRVYRQIGNNVQRDIFINGVVEPDPKRMPEQWSDYTI